MCVVLIKLHDRQDTVLEIFCRSDHEADDPEAAGLGIGFQFVGYDSDMFELINIRSQSLWSWQENFLWNPSVLLCVFVCVCEGIYSQCGGQLALQQWENIEGKLGGYNFSAQVMAAVQTYSSQQG